MSIPKQDERTPVYTEGVCGDGAMILRDGQPFPISSAIDALNAYTSTEALSAPDRNFENAPEAWNLVWEREAELSKLKASTDALRGALAELAGEARFLLNRISELSFDDMSDLIRDFNGHVEPPMSRISKMLDAIEARAALSGSPPPSTEGLRERLRELVAQTLAKYAGDAFSSLNIVFEENSAPWPSSYSPREQDSFRMLADCVLETIAGAAPDAARTALAALEARATAIEECIALGIASCKFTAEQRKEMRSADIIYWQHSLCGDTAIMEVVEKCRALLAGVTAPSEVTE